MATSLAGRFRRAYGAHPAQLLLVLLSLAVAAYAVQLLGVASLWDPDVWWQSIVVWFVGAAVAHDLLLFPLYAAADRVLVLLTRRRGSTRRAPAVPLVNFVRVPLLAVALVTLMFFPGVVRQGADSYTRATGQTQEPFLLRWVVLCAVILLLGLLAYAAARVRTARRPPPPEVAEPEVAPAADRPREAPTGSTGAIPVLVVLVLAVVVAARRRRDT